MKDAEPRCPNPAADVTSRTEADEEKEGNPLPTPTLILELNTKRPQFPEASIGLDSWASHHIVHEDQNDSPDAYPHQLRLAHGTCRCRIQVGRKGIP